MSGDSNYLPIAIFRAELNTDCESSHVWQMVRLCSVRAQSTTLLNQSALSWCVNSVKGAALTYICIDFPSLLARSLVNGDWNGKCSFIKHRTHFKAARNFRIGIT